MYYMALQINVKETSILMTEHVFVPARVLHTCSESKVTVEVAYRK